MITTILACSTCAAATALATFTIYRATLRRRSRGSDYTARYLTSNRLKKRRAVYLNGDTHAAISKLVGSLIRADTDITVGGFTDNVLRDHLAQYKGIIAELEHAEVPHNDPQ